MMANAKVGAGVLSIITESLYDNPIVVFREYVQNSIDSIFRNRDNKDRSEIKIWNSGDNLFFLDNGQGINKSEFKYEMIKIGASTKRKQKNLGYKGIGRLSGIPYCKKLIFVNIYDYNNHKSQMFTIDGNSYDELKNKNNEEYSNLSFSELMDKISIYNNEININDYSDIDLELKKYKELFEVNNTGFLVILQDISPVLENTIAQEDFFLNLQWLLPVDFDNELYNIKEKELFKELTGGQNNIVPVEYCRIFYNDTQIFRPIQKQMLRDYLCKINFKYAVGFHTFKGDKIVIDRKNSFSGIRIYIDNMLLCDENELLQNLENYGLLEHTANGQMQSVRGIGAMIYITDKVNISANARRTFIEVTDNYALEFLKMLAEFVNTIYDTRYALSNYVSAKGKYEKESEKLQKLRDSALQNLKKLAKEDIELISEPDEEKLNFTDLSITDKKKAIKKEISFCLNNNLREYLDQLENYDLNNAYRNFLDWLNNNI